MTCWKDLVGMTFVIFASCKLEVSVAERFHNLMQRVRELLHHKCKLCKHPPYTHLLHGSRTELVLLTSLFTLFLSLSARKWTHYSNLPTITVKSYSKQTVHVGYVRHIQRKHYIFTNMMCFSDLHQSLCLSLLKSYALFAWNVDNALFHWLSCSSPQEGDIWSGCINLSFLALQESMSYIHKISLLLRMSKRG